MRRGRGERGQILPVVALALVALLGISAFAIDVGYAYYAKRQLQSATDAAALAGAQDLPTAATAIATATSYANANKPANVSNLNFTYTTKCTATAVAAGLGCSAATNPNALVVSATASTNTWFAKIFGWAHFDVKASANACSPCSSSPVDVVVVLDRTGSMCLDARTPARHDCTDMNNAKDGVQAMLGVLNPPSAQVGMIAFPPVQTTTTSPCAAPYNTLDDGWDGYDAAGRGYITDALNGNYKLSTGGLNTKSSLVLHTTDGDNDACVQSAGSTSYTEALRQSMAELTAHGRPNVPDFIVFLTDGEANLGSVYAKTGGPFPVDNADDQRPCKSAEIAADTIKAKDVTIYTIGYALGTATPCTAGQWRKRDRNDNLQDCTPFTTGCQHLQGDKTRQGDLESPGITSYDTLNDIASPGKFKNKSTPGDLTAIFSAIAADISAGSSRLVDDGF